MPPKGNIDVSVASKLREFLEALLGINVEAADLEFCQVASRTFVVFCFGVLLTRLADRRMLGRMAGFDIVIMVIVAAVLSRAVTGAAPFFSTLGASALFVVFHRMMGTAAYHWHWFSVFVKGRHRVLVREGVPDEAELRRSKITKDDLDESLRLNGPVPDLKDVAEARLERNGQVSVIQMKGPR